MLGWLVLWCSRSIALCACAHACFLLVFNIFLGGSSVQPSQAGDHYPPNTCCHLLCPSVAEAIFSDRVGAPLPC